MRIPEHPIRFHDIVRGIVEFPNEAVSDPIILRSSGIPVYNYVVVVDDALMKITHVIRGDDHLSNTPKQVALYEALGWPVPEFAHLSTILGSDGKRLSKRHGATSIANFREMGVLPEALMNYLALLGWAPSGGTREIFSPEELKKEFRLERVTPAAAVFDMEKLYWLNRHYVKQSPPELIEKLALPYFIEADSIPPDPCIRIAQWFSKVVALLDADNRLADDADLGRLVHLAFAEDFAAGHVPVANDDVIGTDTEQVLRRPVHAVAVLNLAGRGNQGSRRQHRRAFFGDGDGISFRQRDDGPLANAAALAVGRDDDNDVGAEVAKQAANDVLGPVPDRHHGRDRADAHDDAQHGQAGRSLFLASVRSEITIRSISCMSLPRPIRAGSVSDGPKFGLRTVAYASGSDRPLLRRQKLRTNGDFLPFHEVSFNDLGILTIDQAQRHGHGAQQVALLNPDVTLRSLLGARPWPSPNASRRAPPFPDKLDPPGDLGRRRLDAQGGDGQTQDVVLFVDGKGDRGRHAGKQLPAGIAAPRSPPDTSRRFAPWSHSCAPKKCGRQTARPDRHPQ